MLHILQMSPEIEKHDDMILYPIDIMPSIQSSIELNTNAYSCILNDFGVFAVILFKCRNLVVV